MKGLSSISTKISNRLQFYERNPFKIHLEQFPPKIEIALNFNSEIPLKMNRTKKKVHQKIELTFSFTKEIPLKIIPNKRSTLKFGLKNRH